MSQRNQHKAIARGLRAALQERGVQLSHGECLDLVARASGVKNWNVLSASLAVDEELATHERCDFCGLGEAEGGRLFSGPFSGAVCLRCAEGYVEGADHTDLLHGLEAPGGAAVFLAGKTVAELERYARSATRRAAEKQRAIEQMTALLAGRPREAVDLRPGVETTRWTWLATRTQAEVTAIRDHQVAELKRSLAAQALLADLLQKHETA